MNLTQVSHRFWHWWVLRNICWTNKWMNLKKDNCFLVSPKQHTLLEGQSSLPLLEAPRPVLSNPKPHRDAHFYLCWFELFKKRKMFRDNKQTNEMVNWGSLYDTINLIDLMSWFLIQATISKLKAETNSKNFLLFSFLFHRQDEDI